MQKDKPRYRVFVIPSDHLKDIKYYNIFMNRVNPASIINTVFSKYSFIADNLNFKK